MHLLTFPAPKSDPNTTIFASSSRFLPHCSTNYGCIKWVSQSKSGSEFCNWPKRVSKSPFFLRNHGRSVGVRCEVSAVKDDSFYMRRCVEIAKKALGCTSPNPMVGCVIVKDGKIVGEGFHPKAGQPHAEVFALKDAGILAENATAYVSLEPCNHYGRTPPCTEALIRAKVKHVVIGMVDPNPIVASKGVEKLRESGIKVKSGVEEGLCRKLNEAYIHRMLTGRPLVTLRYSLSFNGQIVNKLGEGAEESGGYYSKLLQAYDGVIISGPSVAKISNYPKSQEIGAHQPLQIIVATVSDSPLRLPALSLATPAIVFKHKDAVIDPTTESDLHNQGVEIVVLDQLDLSPILDYCWQHGLCNVLIDLRGEFAGFDEIIENGLVEGLLQKVVVEVLPFWVRSEDSHVMRLKSLGKDVVRLKNLESRKSEESVVVEGYIC